MRCPQEDSNEDTGFSLEELVAMIAAFKTKSAERPAQAPMRARPTKKSLGGSRLQCAAE